MAALRTLRTLRSISFIRGLQVLVRALIDTFRNAVLHLLLLLFILMFIFAIIGYNFFGYDETGDRRNWGNFGVAMLSLFNFVTVKWTSYHSPSLFPLSLAVPPRSPSLSLLLFFCRHRDTHIHTHTQYTRMLTSITSYITKNYHSMHGLHRQMAGLISKSSSWHMATVEVSSLPLPFSSLDTSSSLISSSELSSWSVHCIHIIILQSDKHL